MKTEEILNISFFCRDLNEEITIKDYFKELLKTLWKEEDEFSGKRPFGNSDWKHGLIKSLIENEIIKGNLGNEGWIEDYDCAELNETILRCISKL